MPLTSDRAISIIALTGAFGVAGARVIASWFLFRRSLREIDLLRDGADRLADLAEHDPKEARTG